MGRSARRRYPRVPGTLELREIMLSAAPVEDWEVAAREYAALAEQALDHGALSHARRGRYVPRI